MNAAVRRRDTILTSSATQSSVTPSSESPLQAAVPPVTTTPDPSIKPEGARPPPISSFSPTQSESIAQKVLSSGGSFSGSFGNGLPKSGQLAAAVTGGAGGSGNPIYVTLAERESRCLLHTPSLKSCVVLCFVQLKAPGCTGQSNTSHLCVLSYLVSIAAGVCLCRAHNLGPLVVVTLLSVMLDNTGFIKAGPKQSEFEPQPGKIVKFSDVQGVDEAKEVGICRTCCTS